MTTTPTPPMPGEDPGVPPEVIPPPESPGDPETPETDPGAEPDIEPNGLP